MTGSSTEALASALSNLAIALIAALAIWWATKAVSTLFEGRDGQ